MAAHGPSPALFFDTVNAYQRTEVLRTAIELDLFSAVVSGGKTADEIATACKASPRGIRILADSLSIIGFLRKESDLYELTEDSAIFLNRASPAYLGGALEFLLTPDIRGAFTQLTQAVRQGGTAISDEGTVSHNNPVWVAFARAMGPVMHMPAQLLANLIVADAQQPLKVLDVAAGHGLFGITVAQRFVQANVTALDWPNVLEVATENARRAGVGNRHHLLAGSAFELDWGHSYDIVLLTNFLHHFDEPTCQQIAEKTHRALKSGGRALTLEFIPNADRISPPATAPFALTMLATTARGDAYTFAEYDQIFTRAGFTKNEFHALLPTNQQAVVSIKS
ncbi:class I SAM-dependent methyltransferase [Schlesneria paludicola]|uniref:class I SAM-dependent methyltransferase n=1 Tax=Schlesneria paludicola TaxID=360056 RepID=UPI00029A8A6C|nr:class I SAM-dependent methyltransferase [Schlesneria paludicola]